MARYHRAMLRIGLPENISPNLLQDFPKESVEFVPLPDHLERDVAVELWIPPMYNRFAKPMFPHLKGVRVVQSLLAGVDWITPWLPREILLCDGQGIHNIPVAEWVMAAILSFLKRFPELRDLQHEQFWDGQVRGGEFSQAGNAENTQAPAYRILGDVLEHFRK